MSTSAGITNTTESEDITISTDSNQELIITQPYATEPTNILVAVTRTLVDVDGRTVKQVRNDVYRITRAEYELVQQVQNYQLLNEQPGTSTTVPVQIRTTREIDTGSTTASYRAGTLSISQDFEFEASKLGGTITASGARQQRARSYGKLERYNHTTGKWEHAVSATTSGLAISISHTYSAVEGGAAAPRPKFKLVHGQIYRKNGTDAYYESCTYPTSRSEVNVLVASTAQLSTPDTSGYEAASRTIYRVQPVTNGDTETTEIRPIQIGPELNEERYTPGTPTSLFNPKQSAFLTSDGIFRLPDNIYSPVVDLFTFIQADINSN